MVQYDIRKIQLKISEVESNTDGQSRATGSIMGGFNEQSALRLRNNNQYNDRSVCVVKFKRNNSKVTTNDYNINEQEPVTIAVNQLDTNKNTCCFKANFMILIMTLRTANVYPYYPS